MKISNEGSVMKDWAMKISNEGSRMKIGNEGLGDEDEPRTVGEAKSR